MSGIKITPITKPRSTGEGPHWLEQDKSLLYVDIPECCVYRYFTETGREQKLNVEDGSGTGSFASFIVPFDGLENEFAVGVGRTISSISWSPSDPDETTKRAVPLAEVETGLATRFNDGKCDPQGRLWAGTMPTDKGTEMSWPMEKGAVYRFDSDLKANEQCTKVSLSNGLAWSGDCKTMYYIDSLLYRVDAFDYDKKTGNIGNRRTVLDCKSEGIEGIPDGMSIDIDGHLWVSFFNGWQNICLDPSVGKVVRSVKMPSKNITSTCWGGPDYSTLYVTSATRYVSDSDLAQYSDSGKTFAITGLGVKGVPPTNYKVNINTLLSLKK